MTMISINIAQCRIRKLLYTATTLLCFLFKASTLAIPPQMKCDPHPYLLKRLFFRCKSPPRTTASTARLRKCTLFYRSYENSLTTNRSSSTESPALSATADVFPLKQYSQPQRFIGEKNHVIELSKVVANEGALTDPSTDTRADEGERRSDRRESGTTSFYE